MVFRFAGGAPAIRLEPIKLVALTFDHDRASVVGVRDPGRQPVLIPSQPLNENLGFELGSHPRAVVSAMLHLRPSRRLARGMTRIT
jgi:hypothetical protein